MTLNLRERNYLIERLMENIDTHFNLIAKSPLCVSAASTRIELLTVIRDSIWETEEESNRL